MDPLTLLGGFRATLSPTQNGDILNKAMILVLSSRICLEKMHRPSATPNGHTNLAHGIKMTFLLITLARLSSLKDLDQITKGRDFASFSSILYLLGNKYFQN